MLRLLLLLALLLGAVIAPGAARAQEDPYAPLASTSYDTIRRGVEALATSGNARALPVIEALRDGTLFAARYPSGDTPGLYIKTDSGFLDARTGKPADVAAANVREVRVNNPVRGAIDSALGVLQLFAADPGARMHAAQAVFAAHDPKALPAIDRALAQEQDRAVKRTLRQAEAAARLYDPATPTAQRLAAIKTIRSRGDLDARSLLASLSGEPPQVAEAAATAVAAIDRNLQLWSLLQGVFYGVSLGSVLLLAATGLAITFGVMGVINMAHGEMVMIGAYATYVVQQVLTTYAPSLLGAGLPIAVPVAFVVAGVIGIAIERLLIRFLYGRPLETLLATWGLSLVLQQVVRSIFGPTNRAVSTPGWMSGAFPLGGLTITQNRLAIIIFAVFVVAALMAVLRATPLGLQMRAVTQNRRMAAAMGIRTPWVDALTFGLGSGVAGIAGVALSQIDNVSPNLGQSYIIDSFLVVVFGGVGNLWGTVVAAMGLGVVNKFLEPIAGAVLGKIVVLLLVILFIQRKPRGLFPLKGRAVEA